MDIKYIATICAALALPGRVPARQAWKRQRLIELGFGVPEGLRLVPVDVETESWWERLLSAGFDPRRPAVVASTGVSMYLTHDANAAILHQISALASGSVLAMTYMRPVEEIGEPERTMRGFAERGARTSGTPFISFYTAEQFTALALDAGFAGAQHVSAAELTDRYFRGRADGLRPAVSEEILVATT
jgi:methyltransferase (TIGR00027 family)